MEDDRGQYTIPPLQLVRMCMLMPVYYKIFRSAAGINTYQASILFTLLQCDPLNKGMFAKTISQFNPMAYETIRRNLIPLTELGYVNAENRRIYITVLGMSMVEAIISKLNSYRGETIQAVELTGTWIERKQAVKQKAINKLANNPHMIKAALQVIEDNKLKGIDSNDK
jgi:hypothetical protein